MCEFIGKYEGGLKTVTGYKVVVKKGGKYYSPIFGIEYKEGMTLPLIKIKDISTKKPPFRNGNWKSPELILRCHWNKISQGRTSVFLFLQDARWVAKDTNCSVVRMTVKNGLMKGKFEHAPIIAGKKIVKIEEITDEERF